MRYTYLGISMVALACVLYLEAYFFENLIPLFLGLGIVLYIVYRRLAFSAQLRAQRLDVRREVLEKMLFAGKPFTVLASIRNMGPPARISFHDALPEGLELAAGSNQVTVELNRGEAARLKYTVRAAKRGYYRLSEMQLVTRDWSGLFEHPSVIAHGTELRVHSSREELMKAHTLAKREHLDILGRSRERWAWVREVQFEGIREYQPGDRFRDIHWKSTSRLLKLMTKMYERQTKIPTTILLDCGRSMRIATRSGSKLDHGIRLTMQLSRILLSGYHPVGLVAFDERGALARVAPGVSSKQYDEILRTLVRLPAEIETRQRPGQAHPSEHAPAPDTGEHERFVAVVASYISGSGPRKGPGRPTLGAEEAVRSSVARGGKGQMFVLISDLESNHDAVVRAASFARAHGHRVLLISPYSGLYETARHELGVESLEQMYMSYLARMRSVLRLQRLGVHVIELGPRDEAALVTRTVRRSVL